jgi:hypothetical protein
VNVLLVQAMIVLTVSFITQRNNSSYPNGTQVAAGLLPFLLLAFLCTITLCLGPMFYMNMNTNLAISFWRNYVVWIVANVFLLFPGLVMMTLHCYQTKDINYLGPMSLENFQVERFDAGPCIETGGMCDGYLAKLTVAWGAPWACQDIETRCTDTLVDYSCSRDVCGYDYCPDVDCPDSCPLPSDNIKETKWEMEQCILQTYGSNSTGRNDERQGAGYNINDTISPYDDPVDYPFEIFYGDCSHCKAYIEILSDSFRKSGAVLSIAGAIMDTILLFFWLARVLVAKDSSFGCPVAPE